MILGAVLAGGASSRFGSDKALAVIGGRTLLDRARATLARVCDAVVVVGRGEISDQPAPGLGPLGGIAGALHHAEQRGAASVLTIACDMPMVPDELLSALLRRAPAYCVDAPILGHWQAALAAALTERLAAYTPSPRPLAQLPASTRQPTASLARPWIPAHARQGSGGRKDATLSVRRWAGNIGALPIVSPSPLANVNTPADLIAL